MDQIIAKLRRGKLLVFLPAMLIVIAASFVAARSASMLVAGNSVFGLAYGFGTQVRSLVQLHHFGTFVPEHNWWAYALRMPFIPLFLAGLSQISTNLTFQILAKNLILYLLVFIALGRLGASYGISRLRQFAISLALVLVPFNILTGCRIEVEEGYLFSLMLIVYILLLVQKKTSDYIWCGLVTAAIYLIKSSMGPFCLVVVLWAVLNDLWRSRSLRLRSVVPMIALVVAMIAWGGYVKARTGRFAVGANASSWNGENLYKGNNPIALQYYPYISLDIIEATGRLPIPIVPHNEWELNDAQRDMAVRFIKEHPADVLRMDLRKARVLFVQIRETPTPVTVAVPNVIIGKDRMMVMLSNLIDHLIFAIFLLLTVVDASKGRLREYSVLALVLGGAYLTPYLAGFLYQRHLVPLFGIVILALSLRLNEWVRWDSAVDLREGSDHTNRVPVS
jgi:hypothetical protein